MTTSAEQWRHDLALQERRAAARKVQREEIKSMLATLKAAGRKVEFKRTQGTYWRGNGFGTAAAEYDLLVNGERRGQYNEYRATFDDRSVWSDWPGGLGGWKHRVLVLLCREVDADEPPPSDDPEDEPEPKEDRF